ncbi:hypothetical protein MNV49_000382 [Pseudohyphozyma bogoriensis]|nr:hypothetical protein MNV49_000382 [Pseudohyphozyma bogoriensis]
MAAKAKTSTTTNGSKKRASTGSASATKKAVAKNRDASESAPDDDEDDTATSDDDDDESEGYQEGSADEDDAVEEEDESVTEEEDVDSEDLDEEEEATPKAKKRKSGGDKGGSAKKVKMVEGGKNTREVKKLAKVPAPKENAETSIILPTTLDFLRKLAQPGHNDREWFAAHDALYRHALLNWNHWIQALIPIVSKVDWTVPELPVKDVIHRIYRDIRFAKEKTPYKLNFGVSLSRTGRKGPWALYYLHIQPNGHSMLAAGKWQPSGPDLLTLRQSILADPKPLRKVLSEPTFVKYFGEPKAVKGKRSSVFGQEDELKNAPKLEGVTKEHPDIDLLKLRSIAVSTRFTDEEVLSPDFHKTVEKALEAVCPFVMCLNEMISPTPPDDDEGEDEESEEGGEEEEEEE